MARYCQALSICIAYLLLIFTTLPTSVIVEAKHTALSPGSRSRPFDKHSFVASTIKKLNNRNNNYLHTLQLNKLQQGFDIMTEQSTATPVVVATATAPSEAYKEQSFLKSTLKMAMLFVVWYAFNAGCKF
jgi:hypothetical protein